MFYITNGGRRYTRHPSPAGERTTQRELRFCRLILDLDLPKLQPISETIHSRNPNTSRHVNVSQLISSIESKVEIGTQEQVIFSLNDHKYKAASGNANTLQKAGANRVVQRGLRENDSH